MRLAKFSVIFLAAAILISGCKKKDNTPANYYSFKGKTYEIIDALMAEELFSFSTDTSKKLHIFQFIFLNVSGKDSSALYIAVADTLTNTLGGNYSSLDMQGNASRGIFPFAWVAASGIHLYDKTEYITGAGGSIDVNSTGVTYTINFNSISAGVYSGQTGTQYNETGKISGKYSGTIQTVTFTLGSINQNLISKSFIQKYKSLKTSGIH
jgi:hypothetical protein